MYERVLNKKMKKISEKSVGDDKGDFRRGRGCEDQTFALKMFVEKYMEKDGKLFIAFMDLLQE